MKVGMSRLASTALAAGLGLVVSYTAQAQSAGTFRDAGHGTVDYTLKSDHPQASCSAFANQVRMFDATRLTVISAETIPPGNDTPAFCRVVAVLDPEIQIEVALPQSWNRRLYMRGNGGYAGERLDAPDRIALRNEAIKRGFAAAQTNTGHDASAQPLASFAENDLSRLIDYSYRAVHLTAQAAKELARAYYARPPAFSYFDGCSTGGRQGLMSAQRYPGDFDGIAAGAPVLDFTGTMLNYLTYAPKLTKADFSPGLLAQVGKAVVAKCDAADGLKDGLISDPRQCRFDPRSDLPRCPASGTCFTDDQVAALETVHAGQHRDGRLVFPGWPWGSEAPDASGISGWAQWFVVTPTPPSLASAQALPQGETRQSAYSQSFLRYFADAPVSNPRMDWRTVGPNQLDQPHSFIRNLVDATDPDLNQFKSHGGKMITYWGWADPALNPLMGIAYYEQAKRATPSLENTYRLFMVPGMQHCGGGDAPNVFDPVTAIIDWVEAGRAPATLLATQRRPDGSERSRPLCPYPQGVRYTGSDPDQASSFKCEAMDEPKVEP